MAFNEMEHAHEVCPSGGIYGETSLEDLFALDEAGSDAIDAIMALDDAAFEAAIRETQKSEDLTIFGEFFDFDAACLEETCLEAADAIPAFDAADLEFFLGFPPSPPATEPLSDSHWQSKSFLDFPPSSPATEPVAVCRRRSSSMPFTGLADQPVETPSEARRRQQAQADWFARTIFYEDSWEFAALCAAPTIDPATYSPMPGVELAPEHVQSRVAAAIRAEDRAFERYIHDQQEKILAGW